MRNKNYSLLKILTLEEILKNRATSEMSRHLGFSFDKYKRWLENKKILKWDEFVDLCERLNLDLDGAARLIFHDDSVRKVNFFSYLKLFNALKTVQQTSDYLNCHPSVIKRYLSGDTSPDIETVFKMIDYKSNSLLPFLRVLFKKDITHPLLLKYIEEDMKMSIDVTKSLTSSIIQATLQLDGVEKTSSTDVWLSKMLNIPLEEIQNHLRIMVDDGLLKWDGADSYVPTETTINFGGISFNDIIPFYQHINSMFINLLENLGKTPNSSPSPGLISSRVYPASLTSIDAIRKILIQAHGEILSVLEKDTNPSIDTFCLLFEMLPLTNNHRSHP